jgi:hypothetical protein
MPGLLSDAVHSFQLDSGQVGIFLACLRHPAPDSGKTPVDLLKVICSNMGVRICVFGADLWLLAPVVKNDCCGMFGDRRCIGFAQRVIKKCLLLV